MSLPTTINPGDSAASHRAHHQSLHTFFNSFEGTSPATFALASHNQPAATINSGVLAPQRVAGGSVIEGFVPVVTSGALVYSAPPSVAATSPIGVPLSSFGGANDSERLAAYDTARRAVGSGLHGFPVILDQNRTYQFTAQQSISDGFAILGSAIPVDQARGRSSLNIPLGNQVELRLPSGGWLTLPSGNTFGVRLVGLSFDANTTGRVFEPNAAATLWTSVLRDISYQNGPGILGSTATKQGVDVLSVEGFANWNNIRDCVFNLGGSDNTMALTRGLVDSQRVPTNFLGDTNYELKFGDFSKSEIRGLYMTAEGHSAILISNGGTSQNDLKFHHCFIEGRNATTPCFGALVRVDGAANRGYTSWDSCWFANAMTDPASGPNAGDLGYIHLTQGTHIFTNCHFRFANANTSTTTCIYATGSGTKVIVRSCVGEGNGSISGGGQTTGLPFLPRVRVVGGATSDVDTSVQLITV